MSLFSPFCLAHSSRRVAGSHDPYPVHEQLMGSGVWQEHFEPLLQPMNQGALGFKKRDVQPPLSPEEEMGDLM